jgi:hypothetical protein
VTDTFDIYRKPKAEEDTRPTLAERAGDLMGADKRRNVNPNASRDYKKLLREKLAAKYSR